MSEKKLIDKDISEGINENRIEVETTKPKKTKKNKIKNIEPINEKKEPVVDKQEAIIKEKGKSKRRVKAVDDGLRDTKALLLGASQTKRILTGMLEGVEYDENVVDGDHAVKGIIYHESYRIIIPASQMGIEVPDDISNQEKTSLYRKYIGAMIGATVSYIILGVDKKEHIAVGSRKIAMGIERKNNYNAKFKGLNVSRMEHYLGAKIPVDARVMSVAGSVVRLDVHGVEAKVYAKEAAWRYTANLSDLFCPGDVVNVMIRNIDRDKDGNIKIDVSIKEATPNNQAENILKYKVGSLYVGVVSGVNENGYYIDIGDSTTGITAFCVAIHGAEIPQIGDKVSCQIVKIDESTGFTLAKITRIIQKANRNKLR